MDYSQLSSTKLYMMRSTDPEGIDAELDRRNREIAKSLQPKQKKSRRKPRYAMADWDYEHSRGEA